MPTTTTIGDAIPGAAGSEHARRWFSPEKFLDEARRRGVPISRSTLYEGLRTNRIPHVRIVRRIAIPHDALDQMLGDQEPAA